MCKQDLPLDAFAPDATHRMGVASLCKDCSRKYKAKWARERRATPRQIFAIKEKNCPHCGRMLAADYFGRNSASPIGLRSWCSKCETAYGLEWRHKTRKTTPMNINKQCSSYLGVHIAENLVAHLFKDVTPTEYGFRGYDLICGKGLRIDVKSACLHKDRSFRRWSFNIKRNTTADYFLLIAFSDRKTLTPRHHWLIPGNVIGHNKTLTIMDTERGLSRFKNYERPLEELIKGFNLLDPTKKKG